jgi:hypothetical protein
LADVCIAADQLDALEQLVPGLEETPESLPVTFAEIKRLIRYLLAVIYRPKWLMIGSHHVTQWPSSDRVCK